MSVSEPSKAARARLRSFHELMQRRVQRILLVSSLYDSFTMSEEGHLHDTVLSQFLDLDLSHIPDLIQVPTGAAALAHLAEDDNYDLVIASIHGADIDAAQLARKLREAGHDVPVVALAYTGRELHEFVSSADTSEIERIFLWQGDVRIFLAIVKYLEDRLNVANDTQARGVPTLLVVEDSVRFYSSFLPTIYAEVLDHTRKLLSEDLSISQKLLRMRARPKILLCTTYEEAWRYFGQYAEHVLGVFSDCEFPKDGTLEKHAGLELCKSIRERMPDIPLVLQSSMPENRALAEEIGASFLLKGSPVMLSQLRELLVESFGFGDFVFRLPDGTEMGRASDLRSLGDLLRTVPAASLVHHAERNHFSSWLKARTEFALAERLRPRKASDFASPEDLRAHLLDMIGRSRLERLRTVIADFDRDTFEPELSITRIGGGSLGGKARGVAFANRVLHTASIDQQFPDVDIYVPPCVVLGTQVFDEFLEYGVLRDYAIDARPEADVASRFLDAPFPRRAVASLRAFLQQVRYPLAVRSSSLLEDSLSQPFAGVYQTLMLPNNEPELDRRWLQLAAAVKRVYASAFSSQAKGYLAMTPYRLEEEKMAVMIQRVAGGQHGDRFYPDFAGVARSHNFYPEPGHRAEDGVVAVALGMGRTVVGGEPCLRFNPRDPRHIVSHSSVADALESSQREFYALDVASPLGHDEAGEVRRYPLEAAEEDGVLTWLGSTYSSENHVIVDGISRPGVRLVTFAQVLKHGAYPLAEILATLLDRCSEGAGAPVEIEFAGNLARDGRRADFAFLQLRPLALSHEAEEVTIGEVNDAELVCRSPRTLGNGVLADVRDVVVVDAQSFERKRSAEVAREVARFDAILRKEARPYVLIGVGRWGSSDPGLGIPVGWNQIAGARVIVEAGFRDFKVAPSQGTHFFQNLTSSGVGYFTVNPDVGEGHVDWAWLASVPALEETELVRHLRFERPLVVRMSGRTGEGLIHKP